MQALVSIIVPVLNEGEQLAQRLGALQSLRRQEFELIVVDGGSSDDSAAIARRWADVVLQTQAGRARQMNAGAGVARGRWLLFLHVDTRLPGSMPRWVARNQSQHAAWGFFPLRLTGQRWPFRLIERAINWRSRFTRVATGDQCLWVRRDLFRQLGGFGELPLREDVALSKRLRRRARPLLWSDPVVTSSRRWESRGIWRTVLLMWWLRLLYTFGVSTHYLRRLYYG